MPIHQFRRRTIPLLLTCFLATASLGVVVQNAWAGGKGKAEKHAPKESHRQGKKHDGQGGNNRGHRFAERDRDRAVMFEYFNESFRSGHCPPGLEKKHNGCLPPGQAKKWVIGRALPPDVEVYELPPAVLIKLEPPPIGYRYVRVARDILMIAEGSGMIMDAIDDLSR